MLEVRQGELTVSPTRVTRQELGRAPISRFEPMQPEFKVSKQQINQLPTHFNQSINGRLGTGALH